jgi:uncharacterized protein (DUF2252 family)
MTRREVPRSRQGAWTPAPGRRDPVTLLEEQAATRLPQLVPIRYGRMLVSPFSFYRGAARIMAADLHGSPDSGITTQICGDAHLSNFGLFGTPERRLVFGVNDFDETLPGPWEWDIKRLAASLEIAGAENGCTASERAGIVRRTVANYRKAVREFAPRTNLEVWYAVLHVDEVMKRLREQLDPKRMKLVEKSVAKTRTRDSMHAFERLTEMVDGEPRIVSSPPLVQPLRDLMPEGPGEAVRAEFAGMVADYTSSLETDRQVLVGQYRIVDLALKVVGVGSVGTRAWIVLMMGRDGTDPLFLQFKEAQASVLEEFLGESRYPTHSERVVAGQHLMQTSSDIFLGYLRSRESLDGVQRDFYGRQLRDWKGSIEVDALKAEGLAIYGELCGWTLARAHARSGDRVALAAYLGGGTAFDEAMVQFARTYADQNERDFKALQAAVASGRITAEMGM